MQLIKSRLILAARGVQLDGGVTPHVFNFGMTTLEVKCPLGWY